MMDFVRNAVKEILIMQRKSIQAGAIEQKVSRTAFGFGDAAQSLGLHPDTLRRKAAAGELKTIRIGRRVLIPASEMQRILAEGLR